MILYIENPKNVTKALLELISEFSKSQDTKSIHRNPFHSEIKILKEILNNQFHSPLQQKE